MTNALSSDTKLAILQDIMAGQDKRYVIAERYRVSTATIDRFKFMYRRRHGKTLRQLAGLDPTNGNGNQNAAGSHQSKYSRFIPKILELASQGLAHRQIAEQLKISKGICYYYIAKHKEGKNALALASRISTNGGHPSNGITLSKDFVAGLFAAEAQRLAGHFAERFDVSADYLGQGLSKFLEYQKVRHASRHGN